MRELQSCGINRPNDDNGYTVTHVSTREKEGFFLYTLKCGIAIVKTSFMFHVLLERCLKANIYIYVLMFLPVASIVGRVWYAG